LFLVIRARDEASRVLAGLSGKMSALSKEEQLAAQASMRRGASMATVGVGIAYIGAKGLEFYANATKQAMEYNREVALTKTQTDATGSSIKKLGDIGESVANKIAVPFDQVQGGLYDIFSSVDVNVPQAKKLLETFSKTAVAGQVNLQDSGRATISILNAFHQPLSKATHDENLMFELVREGVGDYGAFSSAIGRAIPSAARAGESFKDLAGMMAFLTRNGLSTSMAASSAARALDALDNPNSLANMKYFGQIAEAAIGKKAAAGIYGSADAAKKFSVNLVDAQGKLKPIPQIMKELNAATAGMTKVQRSAVITDVFKGGGGTIQARRFLDPAITGYKQLNEYTDNLKHTQGLLNNEYQHMAKTPAAQAQLLSNKYKILVTRIGTDLLPVATKLINILSKIVDWFEKLSPSTQKWIVYVGAIGSALAVVIGIMTAFAGVFLMIDANATIAGRSFLWFGKSAASSAATASEAMAAAGTEVDALTVQVAAAGEQMALFGEDLVVVDEQLALFDADAVAAGESAAAMAGEVDAGAASMAGMMGPLIALTGALAIYTIGLQGSRKAQQLYSEGMNQIANSGDYAKLQKNMQNTLGALNKNTTSIGGIASELNPVNWFTGNDAAGKANKFAQAMFNVNQNLDLAAERFSTTSDAAYVLAKASGVDLTQSFSDFNAKGLNPVESGIDKYLTQVQRAANGNTGLMTTMELLTSQVVNQKNKFQALSDAMNWLIGIGENVKKTQVAMYQTEDQATKSLNKNKVSLDAQKKAGQQTISMFTQVVDAIKAHAVAVGQDTYKQDLWMGKTKAARLASEAEARSLQNQFQTWLKSTGLKEADREKLQQLYDKMQGSGGPMGTLTRSLNSVNSALGKGYSLTKLLTNALKQVPSHVSTTYSHSGGFGGYVGSLPGMGGSGGSGGGGGGGGGHHKSSSPPGANPSLFGSTSDIKRQADTAAATFGAASADAMVKHTKNAHKKAQPTIKALLQAPLKQLTKSYNDLENKLHGKGKLSDSERYKIEKQASALKSLLSSIKDIRSHLGDGDITKNIEAMEKALNSLGKSGDPAHKHLQQVIKDLKKDRTDLEKQGKQLSDGVTTVFDKSVSPLATHLDNLATSIQKAATNANGKVPKAIQHLVNTMKAQAAAIDDEWSNMQSMETGVTDITSMFGGDNYAVSGGSVTNWLRTQVNALKTWAGDIKKLAGMKGMKSSYGRQLLQSLVNAGPTDDPLVKALLGASTLKEVEKLLKQAGAIDTNLNDTLEEDIFGKKGGGGGHHGHSGGGSGQKHHKGKGDSIAKQNNFAEGSVQVNLTTTEKPTEKQAADFGWAIARHI
jgi:TP901 family phage tail tape measure protein